jgi:uncharacterized protein with NAD-binding domain and iron-sulfur cluster
MKRKIAVIGGGMSGLAAAYELTRTPELRDRHEVTLFQLGWRLGGKCASGRDERGRIYEHGLHLWFGCYDNAFAMLKEVYDRWQRKPENPLKSWRTGFERVDFTPIGETVDGRQTFWPLTWPTNPAEPGTGQVELDLHDLVAQFINFLKLVLDRVGQGGELANAVRLDDGIRQRLAAALDIAATAGEIRRKLARGGDAEIHDVLEAARLATTALIGQPQHAIAANFPGIAGALARLREAVHGELAGHLAEHPGGTIVRDALDIGGAVVVGAFTDLIIPQADLDTLANTEFRAWLKAHGASVGVVDGSTVVRSIYDTCFWYDEGDPARPSVDAATALRIMLRITCTYKGSVAYKTRAGMGEVVVVPLYQVLQQQGVKFAFFHKLQRVDLGDDKKIAALHFAQQAALKIPEYDPLIEINNLLCWPAEPRWQQIENGEELRARHVDFESHWCNEAAAGSKTLKLGEDFDDVVLATSLGAYKKLNDDPGPCDALLAADPRLRAMSEAIVLVPTQGVQLWNVRSTAALGWTGSAPATVAGAKMLDVWADMSQTLLFENWANQPAAPQSVHYQCGTYNTQLYRAPAAQADVPNRARDEMEASVAEWLHRFGPAIWPTAIGAEGFDWGVLWDPQDGARQLRLAAQYLRANVTPTECCPGSSVGTLLQRMHSNETAFPNLFLAGCYLRTGLDSTCVEGAVMSGMQASRALCGEPAIILAERFLSGR